MMRSHGTELPREIWNFGKRGEWCFDAQEKMINLRYRLLPTFTALPGMCPTMTVHSCVL